MSARTEIK